LDDKLLGVSEQCQENINVDAVVSQMADKDVRRAGLRGIVPNDVAVTGIAGCGPSVRHIEEQV
jgi:hypothetical protein